MTNELSYLLIVHVSVDRLFEAAILNHFAWKHPFQLLNQAPLNQLPTMDEEHESEGGPLYPWYGLELEPYKAMDNFYMFWTILLAILEPYKAMDNFYMFWTILLAILAMDNFYMFWTILLAILGAAFNVLLWIAHLRKEVVNQRADIVNILYVHLSFNNFFKSVVGVLYGVLVMNSPWTQPISYHFPNRSGEVVAKGGGAVYCNIFGPIQQINIVQGVLLLFLLLLFKMITKFYPHVRDMISKKRRIANIILFVSWTISVLGAILTFATGEMYYMDNLSGICYTTENRGVPGVGVFLFCLPALIGIIGILIMCIFLTYMYKTAREQSDPSKLITMLIYTAVFILCEAPIWLIYFMYNCEEGAERAGKAH
eukprot:sb/3479478/